MKKALLKIFIVAAVFFISIIITSRLINEDSADMTTDMAEASLPVISMEYNGMPINTVFGYTRDMDLSYMREDITPLMSGRKIKMNIALYDNYIESLSYEVRTLNGQRLIENTEITDYEYGNSEATASITVKDLIENNREYELIIKLHTTSGKALNYYTRIINPDEYYVADKLDYIYEFTNKTFNKVLAEDLTKYLESNSQGDNTTFGYVNIHSSFNQVTWGDLNPLRITEPQITVKELSPLTGSFTADFYVSVNTPENKITYYKVREFYRVRYSKERMYLLDYERTMDEIFTDDKDAYSDTNIMLGISSGDVALKESDDGNNIAFVTGGRLYSYSVTENRTAYLFGFYEGFNEDIRTLNDNHSIKVMNIDEAGNVIFIVYGYMNRGLHEGESGIAAYYYDASVNTIEELAYIPSAHSPDLLIKEVEELSYMNMNGVLYMLVGNTLYGIHTEARSVEILSEGLTEGSYKVSPNNRFAAYQYDGKSLYDCQELRLQNFDTGKINEIVSEKNETIVPIDFIGEDLIYGVALKSDIARDKTGGIIVPMYKVVIYNAFDGEIMTYGETAESAEDTERDIAYVVSGEVNGNQIVLKRMEKDADGVLYDVADDQIVNSLDVTSTKNSLTTIAVDIYEKLTEILLKSSIDSNAVKHLAPKMVLFEGERSIIIDDNADAERYVVYGKYGADSFYNDENNAVNRAYDISGIVMNVGGDYIYKKTGRSTKNQIMAIKETEVSEDRSALAVCLDTMLEYEGLVRNSQYMLDNGRSVLEILEDALIDYEVLDLSGCSLDTVLYYVNMDIPVLVMLDDDNAVLLIGFNESNTVILNPDDGTIYKMGMQDSEDWFKEYGNSFITYIKKAD